LLREACIEDGGDDDDDNTNITDSFLLFLRVPIVIASVLFANRWMMMLLLDIYYRLFKNNSSGVGAMEWMTWPAHFHNVQKECIRAITWRGDWTIESILEAQRSIAAFDFFRCASAIDAMTFSTLEFVSKDNLVDVTATSLRFFAGGDSSICSIIVELFQNNEWLVILGGGGAGISSEVLSHYWL